MSQTASREVIVESLAHPVPEQVPPASVAGRRWQKDDLVSVYEPIAVELGLVDSFRLFEQAPRLWSWWDYRNLAFRKNQGLRIDHILVSKALVGEVVACQIDKLPRKNERPSDHAPVVVQLAVTTS